LGVGLSTLNKWVQQHQHDDLMSGPHEDIEKENTPLRKEVQLLREEREMLKKAAIFLQAKVGEVCLHRCLERRMICGISLPDHEGHIARVPCVAGPPDEPKAA
jgi:transposase